MSSDSGMLGRTLLLIAAATAALLLLAAPAWAAPANDAFADAQVLPAAQPGEVIANNFEGTKEAGEPDHAGDPGGHSVWYSWTPTATGPVGISAGGCFGGIDALIGVYVGSSVDSLVQVASNEDVPTPTDCPYSEPRETEFNAVAGTTYRIAVDGRGGAEGFVIVNFRGTPANDGFAAATLLGSALPQDFFGRVKFASKEAGEPDHAGDPGGHSVWFSWTPEVSGPVEISTCSPFSNLDPLLAVYTGTDLNALTQVAANDDTPDPAGSTMECMRSDSLVSLTATAGTTYRIAIDGASGTIGRFNLRLRGRPANDNFAAAASLPPTLPTNAFYGATTTKLATKQAGEPDHAGDPGGHSVWFTWEPTTSGPVAIMACGASFEELDALLAVYTGSDVSALTPVAADDDSAEQCTDGAEVTFDAVAGTTYRIAVDGKGEAQARFNLNLQGGPANDDIANAQNLGGEPFASGTASAKVATKQDGEPNHAGIVGGHSIWFTWTPVSSGEVAISACPYSEVGGDPVLAVYTGSVVDALAPVASDANGGAGCNAAGSEVEFDAVAGTAYRIATDTAGRGGLVNLQIKSKPANDDFANPAVINPTPLFASGSTKFATKQAGEPNHAGNPGGHSVWFSWTPSESGPVDLSACSGDGSVDTLLAVYTGTAVSALTQVAANDDAPAGPPSELCTPTGSEATFNAVAGTTYRIAVDGKGPGQGSVSLAFERTPANDVFADASPLTATTPSYGSANTRLASKQAGEPDHAGNPGGHSVWFSWTPASNRQAALSTCTNNVGNLDALLAVYTGSAVNALTPVASNDDTAGGRCENTDSEVRFAATGGTTYWIAVDGKAGTSGQVQVLLEGLEANDDFGKPRSLGGSTPTGAFSSNRFATKQGGEPSHADDAGGSSVWFKWTAPRNGPVSFDTCASNFDTLLAVYTGTAVNTLAPVAANDDGGGKCSPQSRLSFDAVANTVYRVAVDGKADAQGLVELGVNARPGNDAFAGAKKLPTGLPTGAGERSNVLATKEAGEPNHAGGAGGHSVWFSWTAPASAVVELNVCTEVFDPLVAVYTGTAVNALSPVAATANGSGECDAGSGVKFDASAGTTYRIAVDASGGEVGAFGLWLEKAGAATPRLLTVQKSGGGSGSVSSSPAGIGCGSTCSRAFDTGTAITLTATPEGGSTFLGWSGGGCSGIGTCQITLNADTTVTANFQAPSGGGEGGSGGGGSGSPGPGNLPRKKPPPCKAGFTKAKVKGKQKCVKKKSGKHKGRGKGKSHGQKK